LNTPIKGIAVIAALACLCTGARASTVTVNWGAHAPLEYAAGVNVPRGTPGDPTFTYDYLFSLGATTQDSSSAVANNNSPAYVIPPGATYSLIGYGADNVIGTTDDVTLGTWSFDGTTGSTYHVLTLGPGNYYFQVAGTAAGNSGGLYTLTSAVTPAPVPLPPALGLMAAGLAMVGGAARRRSRHA
jgi:hypothetical protein